MKRHYVKMITLILLTAVMLSPVDVMAAEGRLGFAGGISVENPTVKSEYQYTEMCFLTGTPVKLTGTLTIKKTDKNDVINSTYTYRLENTQANITLNRVALYTTTRETKPNGQITESAKLSRVPTEVINRGGQTYRLREASFSRSMLTDPKAAINYHTGEFFEKKVYAVGGNVLGDDTVTVTVSGRTYAYDQYWSSTETQRINVMIEASTGSGQQQVKWGGAVEMVVSGATMHQIDYAENEPTQISFSGGYVQKNWTESAMEYTARLPEFDKNGRPTDVLKTYAGTENLTTPIDLTRLMVPDIKHLNGFWAEEPISILFGLEVLPGTGENFKAERYVTRREFVAVLINALKEIPADPDVRTSAVARRTSSKKEVEISPFNDVKPGDLYYEQIKSAYQKGITAGNGNGNFSPNDYITRADAIKMIVTALGLENLAPYPYTSTPFTDNDLIPAYARNAASVSAVLGIVTPDYMGRFNPSNRLTGENMANLIYDLIGYMGDELIKDYRNRIMDF